MIQVRSLYFVSLTLSHTTKKIKNKKVCRPRPKSMYIQPTISTCNSDTITPLEPSIFLVLSSTQNSLYQREACPPSVALPHFFYSLDYFPMESSRTQQILSCRFWKQQTSFHKYIKWATVNPKVFCGLLQGTWGVERWPEYLHKEQINEQYDP